MVKKKFESRTFLYNVIDFRWSIYYISLFYTCTHARKHTHKNTLIILEILWEWWGWWGGGEGGSKAFICAGWTVCNINLEESYGKSFRKTFLQTSITCPLFRFNREINVHISPFAEKLLPMGNPCVLLYAWNLISLFLLLQWIILMQFWL